MSKHALWELVKELARTGLMAALAAVLTYLGNIDNPDVVVVVLTVILRAIDRGIHESDNIKLKGLSPI